MRVAMYYSNSDVRLENFPQPKISKDEVLMQVEASGICGSDVMEWYRRDKVPLVLGHEVAGVIKEAGKSVKNFKAGDRIVATHHVSCGECKFCLDGHETVCDLLRKTHFDPGGFCEFLRLPVENLKFGTFKIPKNVSFEAATFVEPLGCVLRGQRLAGMRKGKSVLVVGSGMAGLLHIKVARYLGAQTIMATDIDSFRLQKAKKFGADTVINCRNYLEVSKKLSFPKALVGNPEEARTGPPTKTFGGDNLGEDVSKKILKINRGRLADLVIICVDAQTAFEQGLKSVERGGTVLIFTAAAKDACLPVPTNEIFWRNETTVMSSYAAAPRDLKEALKLISQKKITVEDMITHRLPLEKIQEGFDLVVRPKNSIKVIIQP